MVILGNLETTMIEKQSLFILVNQTRQQEQPTLCFDLNTNQSCVQNDFFLTIFHFQPLLTI